MKILLTFILLGWFVTSELDLLTHPGAKSVSVDGPFETEVICRAYRLELLAMFQQFGLNIKLGPCVERKTI
jgi:hypothetical protein